MEKKIINLPMVAGLLVAGLLAMSAHGARALTWDGTWAAWKQNGVASSCSSPQTANFKGASAINGNDAGQVIAYCANGNAWNCGSVGWRNLYARAYGCPSSGTGCEMTGATRGASVGSTAGGTAHLWHTCQMGYEDVIR